MKHLKNENGEVVLYEILENELSNFLKPDVDSLAAPPVHVV